MNVFQSKALLSFVAGFFCILALSTQLQAQTNAIVISQEEALNTAAEYSGTFGFENVYFSNDDLNRMINDPNCIGIRFYTAINPEMGGQTEIAVGVDANGNELGQYYRSNGTYSTPMNAESATSAVEGSKNSEYATVACTFATGDITNMVMSQGSSGIHIKPGLHEGTYSLVTVGASLNPEGSGSGDSGSTYLKGAAPCPNTCGDGYLTQLGGQ